MKQQGFFINMKKITDWLTWRANLDCNITIMKKKSELHDWNLSPKSSCGFILKIINTVTTEMIHPHHMSCFHHNSQTTIQWLSPPSCQVFKRDNAQMPYSSFPVVLLTVGVSQMIRQRLVLTSPPVEDRSDGLGRWPGSHRVACAAAEAETRRRAVI